MSDFIFDDETRHKKKIKNKKPKKSDHKHEYELIEKEPWAIKNWFNYKQVCKICGKVYTELYIERG
jgi:hypothetical protein